jgi:glutaminase
LRQGWAGYVDLQVFLSEKTHGDRNRAIACLLRNFGVIQDEGAALELYLQQCSVRVTCRELARMGATLACGGRNPVTGVQAMPADLVPAALTIMYTCGMHDGSGQFAFDVGLPAKSGISGGVVASAPGLLGAAVFSPPVNAQGASVRGVGVLGDLARDLRLGVFEHGRGVAPSRSGRGRRPAGA